MRVREAVVAGTFYPNDRVECQTAVEGLLSDARALSVEDGSYVGGLLPHAGWSYSGVLAAGVLQTIAKGHEVDCVILFGAIHRRRGGEAAIFSSGRWETPLGSVYVDDRLAERICGHTNIIVEDAYAHENEHSIEVQLPLIKHLFPGAHMVPIMVPATPRAHEVGQAVARTLNAYGKEAMILGTTDLTHYGPDYGFTPAGEGEDALKWAKEVNDLRFLRLIESLSFDSVVAEALTHQNACGAGAVAAAMAAAVDLGATSGTVLAHTTSAEIAFRRSGQNGINSVGYAGGVFA